MRALTFAGFVRDDGTWDVDPGFVVDVPEVASQEPDGQDSVRVVARGRRGELASTTLTLGPLCDRGSTGAFPAAPTAAGLVELPEDATTLEVEHEGKVVWTRRASRRPPRVEVRWPDKVARGRLAVTWEAEVEDCLATLGWSADGGRTTTPLVAPSGESTLVADLTLVAGGADCRFELLVSDGWHTERVVSDPVALEPGGWQVWVMAPRDGSILTVGETVLLAGQAFHLEEHQAGDDLTWTSSLTGGLGDGARVLTALTEGDHEITARRGEASASVRVTVRPA